MDQNDLNIIAEASDLKAFLENWTIPNEQLLESPEDTTCEIQHSLQTAEAYRWATLLHLHRAVPEIPFKTDAAVMVKTVLQFLATVPTTSRATIAHIYPLFVASCEVDDPGDRRFCDERWASMSKRLRIGNVDKCIEVVKEVWKRRDGYHFGTIGDAVAEPFSPNAATGPFGERKRTFSADDATDLQSSQNSNNSASIDHFVQSEPKRRALGGSASGPTPMRIHSFPDASTSSTSSVAFMRPQLRTRSHEAMNHGQGNFEYTVRGSLHWLRVMADRDWEILLG